MEHIYILKRIRIAERELCEGRFITHEVLVRRSERWLA